LKALEEPGPATCFLLVTSRVSDCLPTIISRCQLVRCGPLSHDMVRRILVEAHGLDPHHADALAQRAGGSVAAALGLAGRWDEQRQLAARLAGDPPLVWAAAPLPETREGAAQFLDALMAWLRDVAVASQDPSRIAHAEHAEALRRQAGLVDIDRCAAAALELVALRDSLEQFVSPRLVASLAREKWLSLMGSDPNG